MSAGYPTAHPSNPPEKRGDDDPSRGADEPRLGDEQRGWGGAAKHAESPAAPGRKDAGADQHTGEIP